MTNPALERAARALIQAKYGDADDSYWEMLDGDAKTLARTMARAVLMAVRDQGMNIYHASDPKSHFPQYEAAEGFEDMIDAILAEGE